MPPRPTKPKYNIDYWSNDQWPLDGTDSVGKSLWNKSIYRGLHSKNLKQLDPTESRLPKANKFEQQQITHSWYREFIEKRHYLEK